MLIHIYIYTHYLHNYIINNLYIYICIIYIIFLFNIRFHLTKNAPTCCPQDAASGSTATELPEDPQLGVMEVIIGPAFEPRSGMGNTWENGHGNHRKLEETIGKP